MITHTSTNRITCILFISILFVLSGCASYDTTNTCSGNSCESSVVSKVVKSDQLNNGILYALPVQDVALTLENSLIKKQDALAKKTNLETKKKALQTKLSKLEQKQEDIEQFNTTIPEDNPTFRKIKNDELFEVITTIAQTKSAIAKVDIEINKTTSDIANFGDKTELLKLKATLAALPAYPSDNVMLSAIAQDTLTSSETFEIKTTSSGLLSGGTNKTEGNLDDIFVAIAGAFGAVKTDTNLGQFQKENLGNFPLFIPTEDEDEKCVDKPFKRTFIIKAGANVDTAFTVVNSYFKEQKYCYFTKPLRGKDNFNIKYNEAMTDVEVIDGLVYPRTSRFVMSLCRTVSPKDNTCSNEGNAVYEELAVNMISSKNLGVMKMKMGGFADHNYEYEFSNGLLTRYKVEQGNELVGFFNMFPAAAKAIVAIPAEIITLKFDLSSKEKAYYEAQTAILREQIKYDYIEENENVVTDELTSSPDEP